MVDPIRNVRCKNPRAVEALFHAPAQYLQHAYRWGPSVTPTPAPVTVQVRDAFDAPLEEPATSENQPEAALEVPMRPITGALCLLMVIVLSLGTVAWGGMPLFGLNASVAVQAGHTLTASIPNDLATLVPPAPPPVIELQHEGYLPLRGGVLIAPNTFKPRTSDYDLVIHFHGNVSIVRQSIEHAGINAALAVINLGERSKVYRTAYEIPGAFEALVTQIRQAVQRRGLPDPRLRRVALTAWSGGYTAIESALRTHASRADFPLDAIFVLDGLHCGFSFFDKTQLRVDNIRGFIQAAHAAAQGDFLLSLTHTQIDPITYGSTKRTAEHLLRTVGASVHRPAILEIPAHVTLPDLQGVARRLRERRMEPASDTEVGDFRVRGFRGNTKEDHAAHLLQMAATALPDLAERWRQTP